MILIVIMPDMLFLTNEDSFKKMLNVK